MSKESAEWLHSMIKVGHVSTNGKAWHYDANSPASVANHYDGAIPVTDIVRDLFNFTPESRKVAVLMPATMEDFDFIDPTSGMPCRVFVDEFRQAICPSDANDVFGIFKGGYQSHDYSTWLLGNVANLLSGDVSICSAGLLANRAKAWVQVAVPGWVSTPEGVKFRPYLLAYTSLDGSLATTYARKIRKAVCDNTLEAAIGEKSETVKVKHSRYSNLRIDDAKQALNLLDESAAEFAAEVARLSAWEVTPRMFGKWLDKFTPVVKEQGRAATIADNKRAALRGLYAHDDRVSPWQGTAYGVVQLVNTYNHHVANVRGASRQERNMDNVINGKFAADDALALKVLATV